MSEEHSNKIEALDNEHEMPRLKSFMSRLRRKYSAMLRERPEEWEDRHVSEFFRGYRKEITELLNEYPKMKLDGVTMLRFMDARDRPYVKELIQSKFLSVLWGKDVLFLPRYVGKLMRKTFGVNLKNESFGDGFAAMVDGEKYIEYKMAVIGSAEKRIKETVSGDIGFVAVDDIGRSFRSSWRKERLWSARQKGLSVTS